MILTQFATPPPPSWSFSINLRAYAAYKGAAMFQGDNAMATYDLTQRARDLSPRIPALIISSNHDANYVAKADGHAIPLHHVIPNSRLVLWNDVGHFPFVERPADCYALIKEFIDGHP
jgi:pimeloyl-ACP methyl ester carboxylesterase